MSMGPTLIFKENTMTDDALSNEIFNTILPEKEYGKIKSFDFVFLKFTNPYASHDSTSITQMDDKPFILFSPNREHLSAKTWSTGDSFNMSFETIELAKEMWNKIKRVIIGQLGYCLRGNEKFENFEKVGFTFKDIDYTEVNFCAKNETHHRTS